MDEDLDIDDFLFWDVNDDSLFVENDEFLAGFMAEGDGSGGNQQEASVGGSRPVISKKHKPMLSKDDKRRTYAKMFSEAFNSGDIKQLTNFVFSYCTPECVMIQKCVVAANSYFPKYLEVFGSSAILEFWSNTFLTVPDCLMVMLETKLRIRNRQFQSVPSSSDGSSLSGSVGGKSSLEEIHNEGSSIVCSFSFTGTKIYTTKMEGAIIQPPGMTSGSTTASSTDLVSLDNSNSNVQIMEHSGLPLQQQQALALQSNSSSSSLLATAAGSIVPPKPPKPNKKRTFSAINDTSASSAVALSYGGTAPGSSSGSTTGPPESSIDKFNIFLHPPRKYSTLAGTPFGGSPHYYTKGHTSSGYVNQLTQVAKMSDYISINANTKFSTGSFMEQEGYINFLGTLTMTLDSDNKICKFEFIYSHMD